MMKYPNIEAERARAQMPKVTLAQSIGVTVDTMRNWQNDRTEIPVSKLVAMAEIFNVSTDYLLGRTSVAARQTA